MTAAARYDGIPVNLYDGHAICNLCLYSFPGPHVNGCESCPGRSEATGVKIVTSSRPVGLIRRQCSACGAPVDSFSEDDPAPLCLDCDEGWLERLKARLEAGK